jgi:hypothetical protein
MSSLVGRQIATDLVVCVVMESCGRWEGKIEEGVCGYGGMGFKVVVYVL